MSDYKRLVVCTRILGGLGNQMFQYAAGRSLARHLNAKLVLDASGFDAYGLRSYALDAFEIKAKQYDPSGTLRRLSVRTVVPWLLSRRSSAAYLNLKVFKEPYFHFWDGFYKISESCYLDGYWQSPLYFENIREDISSVFSLDRFRSDKTMPLEDSIRREERSVAVHIRRGDYVSNPKFRSIHGILGREYYDFARAIMERLVNPTQYFIFSDDAASARVEFSGWTKTTFVSGNPQEQDMMLMSMCDHAIIANSSFSWWATWLNRANDRVVIAPRSWFAREKMRITNTADLYPDGWILL